MTHIRKNIYGMLLILLLPFFVGCSSDDDNTDYPNPELLKNETVIYEANPGLFGTQNTFAAITNRLDEIKALGTNVLWLMPIQEQGVLNAIGSPYCVKDFKKVNPAYGTLDELKSLINAAHGKGMKVILDWIANHTAWDNAWIENKSWYTQDENGNIVSPPGMDWNDVADLNFDNTEMRKAMLDAMKYWITETNIDGYRCDYAEGVPSDFWREAIKELKQLKGNDLFMLAEGGKSSLYADGFDMVYGWDFAYALQDVYTQKTALTKLYEIHKQEYAGVPTGKQRMRYITNHDMASEKSPIQVFGNENGAISAYVIASMLGGSPMIFSSQEIGYARPLSFFTSQSLNWNENQNYTNAYKKIMDIRNASSALKSGSLKTYDTGTLASFYRSDSKEGVLIMVNTTNKAQTVKVPIERVSDHAKDLMNNTTLTIPSMLDMEPYQYLIWKIEK